VDVASPTQDDPAPPDGGPYPCFKPRKQFLPRSTVLTSKERSDFCSDVLCARSRFRSLLKESIYNLGFVYEEGGADFRKADANGHLTNLGKLTLERWESGILAIHFLFPSEKQAINARTAEGPHYQVTFHEFSLAMQKYRGPDIRFVFYAPNSNHSTDYLFVLNGPSAHQYTSAITWKKLKKRSLLDCCSVISMSTLRQAAGNFSDYGFCTSQNSNRKESITGHAMPAIKPNSTDPEIIEAFVALTSFASNTRPLWRPDKDHFALIDDAILMEFAHKIDPRNRIPSMHLAVTSNHQPCGCHNDATTNSKDHPDVVCISIIEGEKIISCNAQQRKSIDDYKLRCSDFGEPLLAIEQVYGEMNQSRRSVSAALFDGNQVMHGPGFWTIRNECNMDPTSYSMTVLDCTPMLGRHHNLSLPELHSIQMAFHVLPHTCMFFGVASPMLLEVEPSQIPASYRKGYGFGFLLASMMVELFLCIRESGVRQVTTGSH
jgi:hypothetical protein